MSEQRFDPAVYAIPPTLLDRLLSPTLVLYLDRVKANITRVIDAVGGDPDRWRPHVKTSKLTPVFESLVAAGVRSFKCATTREVACLLRTLDAGGVDGDVVLAHPQVGPNLARLGELAAATPSCTLSVLCEDPDAVDVVPGNVGIFVDVNPGMNRTGIPHDRHETITAVARSAGRRFRGVHFYEGHLHGLDEPTRRRRAFECYDRLMDVVAAIEAAGVGIPEITTSGTPTFGCALDYEPLRGRPHRVSPGTVVLCDLRAAQEIPGIGLEPAALVLARIVSRPADDIVTCDAGSKSIAAEAGDPCGVVIGYPGLEAMTPSEEHLPLRIASGPPPERGEAILLVPRHVCPTVNLAEQVVVMQDGDMVDVVSVAARAHDVLVS